jgi:uncharacterized protein
VLIQFRLENHRSFRDRQTMSLVAASNGSRGNDHVLHPDGLDEALLPAVALYGANASGKTNVLLALSFIRSAVINSHRLWEPEAGVPHEPFALSEHKNAPAMYDVDMLLDGVRYRYGFRVNGLTILEEWLYTWPNGKMQTLFTRENNDFKFGRHLRGDNETIRGLTRPNSLFLSSGAQNNHPALLPIFRWFQSMRFELSRRRPSPFGRHAFPPLVYSRVFEELFSRQASLFPDEDEALQSDRDAIVRLLQEADTGIIDIRVEPDADDERRRAPRRVNLSFRHKAEHSEGAWLPLEAESAGTVTLLELSMRLVPALRIGGVLLVDEIEASLHPILAGAILQLFCDKRRNPKGAQLIFTTHDTNLLGNALGAPSLRRDQIWFTEKDSTGASHLYPLTDFHPRKQENLERGYLQGRYGAIPFLGDLVTDGSDSEES